MYRKILIALENSRSDEAILSHITEFAVHFKSELVLLHVADVIPEAIAGDPAVAHREERPVRRRQPVPEPLLQLAYPLFRRGWEPQPACPQGLFVPLRRLPVLCVRPLLAPAHQERPPVLARVRHAGDPGSRH